MEGIGTLQSGRNYRVELSRNGHVTEIKVNGVKATSRVKTVAFPSGTSLFIGGFPQGMSPRKTAEYGFLKGCVNDIDVDGQRIDIDSMEGVFSGDLAECNPESRGDEVKLSEKTTETPERVALAGKVTYTTTEEPQTVEIQSTEETKFVVEERKEKGTGGGWSSEEESSVTLGTEKPLDIIHEKERTPAATVATPSKPTVSLTTTPPTTTTTTATTVDELVTEKPIEDVAVAMPVDDDVADPYIPPEEPKALCEKNTCGEHGECEVVNATHVVCQCKDYYDGPNCENCKGKCKFR